MHESRFTYAWVMSHIWMSHDSWVIPAYVTWHFPTWLKKNVKSRHVFISDSWLTSPLYICDMILFLSHMYKWLMTHESTIHIWDLTSFFWTHTRLMSHFHMCDFTFFFPHICDFTFFLKQMWSHICENIRDSWVILTYVTSHFPWSNDTYL